ncbi:Neurotactin [Armadillidium nasatum]|uniref:Neurotactin n=1 Tax=Armadillidium nasatum TaxID=96803 RepID=A0A5N5SWQ5_9CRUS|nr:Neurotactin [Armadillidium nasatum]
MPLKGYLFSRVGISSPLEGQRGGIAITSQAFQDPLTYKNPYLPAFGTSDVPHFGTFASPYYEAEIQDYTAHREPRYLDLFEPGVQVIRDPKLDQPCPTWKERLRLLFSSNLGAFATSKFVIGCCVLLVVLIIGIVAIVSISKLLRSVSFDPRVTFPYVTTATSCGLVKGIVEKESYVFRGIPYALPPLEELRFNPAKVHDALEHCWTGNLSANVSRPCWSYDSKGAVVAGYEDCLLLDVFTPKLGYENPLPVVVYVGGVSLGSDARRKRLLQKAGEVSVQKNIVLVSPQIRRGFLGFIPSPVIAASTYPHTAGNQGASDLVAALIWIHHNIEHFGGDKKRVTLLGHQAGAALFWPLINRIKNRKLVHSVWLTGAAPLQPHIIWRNAPASLARPFNCSSADCLYNKSAEEIMQSASTSWRRSYGRPWLVADGIFVPMEEEIPTLPIVFGATEQSAAESLGKWRHRISSEKDIENVVLETLQEILHYNEEPYIQTYHRWRDPPKKFDLQDASKAVSHYLSIFEKPWELLTTLVSDVLTTCPLLERAASLARQWDHSVPTSKGFVPPIYAYVSSHQRSTPFGLVADGLSDIEAILGVFKPKSESDRYYISTMQKLFFTFVKTNSLERHFAKPAHHGIYVVKGSFTVQRDRTLCDYWTNSSHLARRY